MRRVGESGPALAVLALALVGTLFSARADDGDGDSTLLQCKGGFYRHTPPGGLLEAGRTWRCYTLRDGGPMAALYDPTCQRNVFIALALGDSNGWGAGLTEQTERQEDFPSAEWDALVSQKVREETVPQCTTKGGVLHVLSGVGMLTEECAEGVQWSAACCTLPEEKEGSTGFSLGMVQEAGREPRVVTVKELEELVGLTEVFAGGCGELDFDGHLEAHLEEDLGDATNPSQDAEPTDTQSTVTKSADTQPIGAESADSESANTETVEEVQKTASMSQTTGSQAGDDLKRLAEGTDVGNETQDGGFGVGRALVYVLSTSVSVLSTPLRIMFNSLTELPGQACYVLQEDLMVLAEVPGNTLSLFGNMASDLASGVRRVFNVVRGTAETCGSVVYSCSSPLVGALFGTCQTGLVGMGTLAGDGVGIAGGVVDCGWGVAKRVGGVMWDQGGGFTGTMLSEMGKQAKTVGGGVGTLVWRVLRAMGRAFNMVLALVWGVVGNTLENVREAFGGE